MSGPLPADAARLLKRVARFKQRSRAAQSLGLPMPFRRWRKRTLVERLHRDWPGGYVATETGDLVYLPQTLDFQALRVLFGGPTAHQAALKFLPPGGVALDVGANLGEWTLPLAKAVGVTGAVMAIEPNPTIAAALTRTLRLNNLPQAQVIETALSDRDGEAALLLDAANSGASRLGAGGSGASVTVPVRTLDQMAAEAALTRLDLVKLDVEGHERRVLAGATETLARFTPALVMESGHEAAEDRAAIADLLERLGYALEAALHDHGALPATTADYRAWAGACGATEAHDLLWLKR